MTTDPKIYTAKEVASLAIGKEKIDRAVEQVTKEAYIAAKYGGNQVIRYSYNLDVLNEIARRLGELGYTTEIIERAIGDPYVIVRWDTD